MVDHGQPGLNQPITDPLTGAYSRALLLPRLGEELSRAARGRTGCSLFLFDVDYFKSVNDAYGHARGDDVLVQLVGRIGDLIRGYDVLFRYGGDEFVLLLPDTGKADAVRVALRLTEGIRKTPFAGEPPLSVSVSLGVASSPEDGMTPEALLECADRRNYLAKRRGRACAVADDVEGDAKPSSSRLLERDLAVSAVQEFLTRLVVEPFGALRVTGEPGCGYTRFLAEVAKLGRLRGFQVVDVPTDGTATDGIDPAAPVLLLADRGAAAHAAALVQRLRAGAGPPVLGLVYAAEGWTGGIDVGLPQVDVVELPAWSTAALRIWLRMTLQGEPSTALMNWLVARGGSLPAHAEREVARLQARGAIVAADGGGWTVADSVLSGPARPRRKLPVAATELIGRQRETAQVVELLNERRLVTLTGPGGIGKTRLSLAVAAAVQDRFDDGVTFVPLAEATGADLVVSALARALQIAELPGEPLLETVAQSLAEQRALLVLDNFEQVAGAAPMISELLAAAPRLRVLVSSRERLSLYGEQVYRVPPLPLPDLDGLPAGAEGVAVALANSPALALFHARARGVAYDFALGAGNLADTAALCRRLDGLPLAIELAATRADTLSPAQMLAQLTDRLDLPGEGPLDLPDRQRTLRGAIDWSVALLEPADVALFTRLGAFHGGCSSAAVAALYAGGSTEQFAKRLGGLVDKSLLRVASEPDGEARYSMLETIRAYAADRLDADPHADRVRLDHATHFAGFAADCGRGLTGPDQAVWAGRVELEYENLRAAFTLLLDRGRLAAAATVVLGLWRFWRNGNHITDGRGWLDRVVRAPGRLDGATRARVLHAGAIVAAAQDDHTAAAALARESLGLAEGTGDTEAVANAYNALGIAALGAGDYPAAGDFFEHCLAAWTTLGRPLGMAMAHGNLTKVALRTGDIDAASTHAGRCLEMDRAEGNTRGVQLGLECLAEIALARGDVAAARAALDESLALSRALRDAFGEAMALHQLGQAARLDGDAREAARLTGAALSLRHEVGDREDLAMSLEAVASLAVALRPEASVRMLAAAEALRKRHRLPFDPDVRTGRDGTLDRLRAVLDRGAVNSAWAAGHATPLDVSVGEALELARLVAGEAT